MPSVLVTCPFHQSSTGAGAIRVRRLAKLLSECGLSACILYLDGLVWPLCNKSTGINIPELDSGAGLVVRLLGLIPDGWLRRNFKLCRHLWVLRNSVLMEQAHVMVYGAQFFQLQVLRYIRRSRARCDYRILVDCGELYDWSVKRLISFVNIEQELFRFYGLRQVDKVLVCSPGWVKDSQRAGVPYLYSPGIPDQMNYNDSQYDSPKQNYQYFLFMGRLVERECPENILKIFYQVHLAQPEVHFIFIGDDEYSRFFGLIKTLGIPEDSDFLSRLEVKGFVRDAERQTMVRHAIGTIILRRNTRENRYLFPSRVVEFFQFGCPVVMNNIESFSYNFWTGCDQFVEAHNDVDRARDLLLRLQRDPVYRKGVIDAQSSLYHRRYSAGNVSAGLGDFFAAQT